MHFALPQSCQLGDKSNLNRLIQEWEENTNEKQIEHQALACVGRGLSGSDSGTLGSVFKHRMWVLPGAESSAVPQAGIVATGLWRRFGPRTDRRTLEVCVRVRRQPRHN